MSRFDLRTAAVGDRVQHEFLVRDRAEKMTKAGMPFVVLTLANGSGSIETAPIWSEKLDWCLGADRGKVVQVIGDIGTFGDKGAGKRQLTVTAPLRVLPSEQFDPTEFLPRIDVETDRVWDAFDELRALSRFFSAASRPSSIGGRSASNRLMELRTTAAMPSMPSSICIIEQ